MLNLIRAKMTWLSVVMIVPIVLKPAIIRVSIGIIVVRVIIYERELLAFSGVNLGELEFVRGGGIKIETLKLRLDERGGGAIGRAVGQSLLTHVGQQGEKLSGWNGRSLIESDGTRTT